MSDNHLQKWNEEWVKRFYDKVGNSGLSIQITCESINLWHFYMKTRGTF